MPNVVAKAERIVLPGVGAFADCMNGLSAVPGMVDVLKDAVLKRGMPFLGFAWGCNCSRTWAASSAITPGLAGSAAKW